jgi:hypothetical protein
MIKWPRNESKFYLTEPIKKLRTVEKMITWTRGRAVFVTYVNERFRRSLASHTEEARKYKIFDEVLALTPVNLSLDYRQRNAKLIAMSRGGGYWTWKSRVVW